MHTAMKIININTPLTYRELLFHLTKNIDSAFREQRQTDMNFKIENTGEALEISQPEHYEGFLFRIHINGNELHITRNEHYTDDVNSLTIESILNKLFADLAGNKGIAIVQEG